MFKKFLATGAAIVAAGLAFGQTTTLTANTTAVTAGPDLPFPRTTYFTFDLRGTTTSPAFWTGSEVSVDVVGAGTIFHSSGQRDPDGDANTPIGDTSTNNNLFPPSNPQPPTNDSRRYDTYMAAVSATGGVADPQFAAPGGVVSSATRIRGLNPQNQEIPLAWFSLGQVVLNNALLGRLTFAAEGRDLVLAPDAAHNQVFATIVGRTTSSTNPQGTPFSFTIYQTPEPGTLALLALGGLAGLIRRR